MFLGDILNILKNLYSYKKKFQLTLLSDLTRSCGYNISGQQQSKQQQQ